MQGTGTAGQRQPGWQFDPRTQDGRRQRTSRRQLLQDEGLIEYEPMADELLVGLGYTPRAARELLDAQ